MLKLKGLTIVTIADASKLSSVAGNHYLWEAVRVDQFSMIASRAAEADARAKIKDVTDADKIEEQAAGSNSLELTATGSKLYVAYRVVTISQPALNFVDSTETLTPSADVNLGSEYSLHFAPARKGETMFNKDCAVMIAPTSYMVLDSKGHPTESNPIKLHCGGPYTETYPIGFTTGSQRATIDSLHVKDLRVWPVEGGEARTTGGFTIERRTMQLDPLNDPSAPGW